MVMRARVISRHLQGDPKIFNSRPYERRLHVKRPRGGHSREYVFDLFGVIPAMVQ
jgi:hypothetical protein